MYNCSSGKKSLYDVCVGRLSGILSNGSGSMVYSVRFDGFIGRIGFTADRGWKCRRFYRASGLVISIRGSNVLSSFGHFFIAALNLRKSRKRSTK